MRRVVDRIRYWVPRLSVALLIVQVLAMLGLTGADSLMKKRRKLTRFPHERSDGIAVGEDNVSVYMFGSDVYRDMLSAIDSAAECIYFETYIWKGDVTGTLFKEALAAAADRGVKVYAIYDGFANLVVPRSFYRMPEGVNLLRHPSFSVPWSPRQWGRDHRKLLVVDHTIGFVGGYNIGRLYATGWRDTHARIVGPSAAELEYAFIDFWNEHPRRGRRPRLPSGPRGDWHAPVRVHRNTPRVQVYPIRNMYLEAINRASERIWLTHAYLIPDDDLVAELRQAAKRGVDVRIIVPARSNHVVADWLSRGFYTSLLSSGVRLFLYQGAMVHSKTAVIDGTWSTIGTANLDRLSLWGNYEVNVEVLDETLAERMEEIFRLDETNTVELTIGAWERRSLATKGTEMLLSPWRPFF